MSANIPNGRVLVLGASGFLGSHVARALAAQGRELRLLVRATSDLRGLAGVVAERVVGDVLDRESIRRAMQGCDAVYHCVVDARSWLRDPLPLYRVNVDGLRNVLEEAQECAVRRVVYTSSIVTIGLNPSGVATEADTFNWGDRAPAYVKTRVLGERAFLEACRRGLDGVACCVGTTYGDGDWQPTPHGRLVGLVVQRRLPVYWDGGLSVVGVQDAAEALLLAEGRGRAGARYIVADRYLTMRRLVELVAGAAGVRRPWVRVPQPIMALACALGEGVSALRDRDSELARSSLALMHIMGDFDSRKAREELGWEPRPFEQSVQEAVAWFRDHFGE
ncbi:MAG: NAD-dependent epimerase/dehydratase family protein [bacterium]